MVIHARFFELWPASIRADVENREHFLFDSIERQGWWFDIVNARNTLERDVAHRVLFQMSATDSSNLMDSAAAIPVFFSPQETSANAGRM